MSARSWHGYYRWPTVNNFFVTPPSFRSFAQEIEYINDEKRHVEGLITQLQERHAGLQRRLDKIQDPAYPLSMLPPETLSHILQYACPTPTSHLVLRSVSSYWNQIVQSTPQLWARIYLGMITKENADTCAAYIELCLRNSGSVPLKLSLCFSDNLRIIRCLISSKVDNLIIDNANRIAKLRLHQPPPQWISLISSLDHIASLEITSFCHIKPKEELSLPITLNKLVLNGLDGILTGSFTARIRVLVLHHDVPIDICFQLLVTCPNLVKFHCSRPSKAVQLSTARSITSPIVCQHLRDLAWMLLGNEMTFWNNQFLSRVQAPLLEKFRWYERFFSAWNPNTKTFFSRLPLTLNRLEFLAIRDDSAENDNLMEAIALNTKITHIELNQCGEVFLNQVLQRLRYVKSSGIMPFPNLTSIRLINMHWEEADWGSTQMLLRVLRERQKDNEEFSVELHNVDLPWGPREWRDLQLLARRGLKVSIIDNGHSVQV